MTAGLPSTGATLAPHCVTPELHTGARKNNLRALGGRRERPTIHENNNETS